MIHDACTEVPFIIVGGSDTKSDGEFKQLTLWHTADKLSGNFVIAERSCIRISSLKSKRAFIEMIHRLDSQAYMRFDAIQSILTNKCTTVTIT
jgi:hypothetical protein